MKAIYPNEISAVSMTNEDSDFPDDNVLTPYPKQVAKSTGTSTTFTCTVDDTCGAVAIFNCNATDVDINVDSGDATYNNLNPSTYDYLGDGAGKIWQQYVHSGAHTLTIDMSVGSGVVECGIIYAGPLLVYTGALEDMRYTRMDHSIIRELNRKGAIWVLDGDQKTVWNFRIVEAFSADYWEFWDEIVGKNKLNPLPCMFKDDDYRHTAFARLNPRRMPVTNFNAPNDGIIKTEFIEVN